MSFSRIRSCIGIALQMQLSLSIGFAVCLAVSIFYRWMQDPAYPAERPGIILAGLVASLLCFLIGSFLVRKERDMSLSMREGASIVILTWAFATAVSAMVYVLAGFPIPDRIEDFSLLRRIIDACFESVSGFTTAGGSILPSVEAFPRSLLLWRSTTHLLGGMGIAYLAVTLLVGFRARREAIINGEAEGPNIMRFNTEAEARSAGFDFLKIYLLLTGIMCSLLIIAGVYGRSAPYTHVYDNVFDAVNHAFSTMGTGGFGIYDESVGLPIQTNKGIIIGGLENPMAEWIITAFMIIAGSNLSLWYILFFSTKHWRATVRSRELRSYLGFIAVITVGIWWVLYANSYYSDSMTTFRYAIFNVATIISTTGLGNTNFHLWPAGALGLLFLVYFTGGMVGSTSGGLKFLRFNVLFTFIRIQLQNFLFGRHITRFNIDGVQYDMKMASLIVVNIVLYIMVFLVGAIAILITSPVGVLPDGTTRSIDLLTGVTASIANLGNIGPTAALGSIDAGPTGNYFAFSVASKIVMSLLMLIGRVGVFTFIIPFVSAIGMREMNALRRSQQFDADEPRVK